MDRMGRIGKGELRVLAPTGNLGHSTIRKPSYEEGLKRNPHFVVADAGSADIGPSYLGAAAAHNPVEWAREALRLSTVQNLLDEFGCLGVAKADEGTDRHVGLLQQFNRDHLSKP